MPTDDTFDVAWGQVSNDNLQKFSFFEGLARDFGFEDYANRMRDREEAQQQLQASLRAGLVDSNTPYQNMVATQQAMFAEQEAMRQAQLREQLAALQAQLAEQESSEAETVGDTMGQPPVPSDDETEAEEITTVESAEEVMGTPPEAPSDKRTKEIGESFDLDIEPDPSLGQLSTDYEFNAIDMITGANELADKRTANEHLTSTIYNSSLGDEKALRVLYELSNPAAFQGAVRTTGIPESTLKDMLKEATKKAQGTVDSRRAKESQDSLAGETDSVDVTMTGGSPEEDRTTVKVGGKKGAIELPLKFTENQIDNVRPDVFETDDKGDVVTTTGRKGPTKKKSDDIVSDVWSVVKDPFANPFYNRNAFAMTDQKPPEVTYDDTPTFEVDTSLLKKAGPENALKEAGFDSRSGDDVSLLPTSIFTRDDTPSVDNMSLLPKGWKADE
tara:strand:+ start:9480 stop:10811 length:1332 start_codon:yes stop_codon:yes gene_type:complete